MNNITSRLKTLIDNSITNDVNTVYDGDVVVPPNSYLPAVIIAGTTTSQTGDSTEKDEVVFEVTIKVVADVKEEFNESGTGEVLENQKKLKRIMEDRNNDGSLKSDTIFGILRENITDDNWIFNDNLTANYDPAQVGNWFLIQAEMTLEFEDKVPR